RFGLRGERDQLPRELAVWRSLEHGPRARAANRPVPNDLDRNALLLEFARARVPNRHHVDFTIADELLRLGTLTPPHFDVRFDLVELVEGAVDVEGVELIARDPVGEQREDQRSGRIAQAQAAVARESLDVPEIRPRPGTAVAIFVTAIAKGRADNILRDAIPIGDNGIWRQGILVDDRPIDRLRQALPARPQPLHGVDRRHIELVGAALHLRLDLAVRDRRDGADLDACRRGEGFEEGGILSSRIAPAPGVHI